MCAQRDAACPGVCFWNVTQSHIFYIVYRFFFFLFFYFSFRRGRCEYLSPRAANKRRKEENEGEKEEEEEAKKKKKKRDERIDRRIFRQSILRGEGLIRQ